MTKDEEEAILNLKESVNDCPESVKIVLSALEASQREAEGLREDLKKVIESKNFMVGAHKERTEFLSSKLYEAHNAIAMVCSLRSVTDIRHTDEWHIQLFQALEKFEELCKQEALAQTEKEGG